MDISADYYLSSPNDLEIERWLHRTEGSTQAQIWRDNNTPEPVGDFIDYRRYFTGRYRGERFFAKEFLRSNRADWSIKQSIEYQFENLLLLSDLEYVPKPMFLTEKIIGMEYVSGGTIRNLCTEGQMDLQVLNAMIPQIYDRASAITSLLKSVDRKYDLSPNNIIIKPDGEAVFVDFDYCANEAVTPDRLVSIIMQLVTNTSDAASNSHGHGTRRKWAALLRRLSRRA